MHDGLHRCVVGGAEALAERERARALAVIGVVTSRRYDPRGPADLLEVHVERFSVARGQGDLSRAPPFSLLLFGAIKRLQR